ncbi:MAG: exopolysaccharide biosynthesis polyprenyl glycosylphosphotransferase [Lachnospiraceae bacterium]|nr:exopolysaccharide biosynthesis polyprenyl glycosylphosphotransferase [Lachnospiraceae bacterium]
MYEKRIKGWRKHIDFILLDIVCLQLAFVLAYIIRFNSANAYVDEEYKNLAILYVLADFLIAVMFDSFKNVLRRGLYQEFTATVRHVCLVEGVALLYLFSTQRGDVYSRLFFYTMAPVYLAISYLARSIWKSQLKSGHFHRPNRSLLIVAPKKQLEECVESICSRNYSTYRMISAVATDANMQGQMIGEVPVVTAYNDVVEYVCREWVDEVFLYWDNSQDADDELINKLRRMGVITHIVIAKKGRLSQGKSQQVGQLGDYTVLTSSLNFATSTQLHLKRLMDIIGGFAGCIITLLLVIFVGPLIYISSPGPIFFSQERVGRNGKKFKMYKFRTMYPDAEERKAELMAQNRVEDGMMFKLDYDPRIIGNRRLPDGTIKEGLGSFLRKTSLDEFPQMVNILLGDMSLVGTRPPTVDEWEKYELHHRARLAFRPGLTGLWQVSGRSNITDFEEVVRLDTEYIDNWNIGLDIKILLQTFGVVMKNDGAM